MVVSLGVDGDRLGVGSTADLLLLQVGLGLDGFQFAFLLAFDFCGFTVALGAELGGNAGSLGNHALENLLPHLLGVVDPFEPEVEQLDAELRVQLALDAGDDFLCQRGAALGERFQFGLGFARVLCDGLGGLPLM